MLEQIKLAIRIKTDAFDSELLNLIDACKADLIRFGIKAELLGNPVPADFSQAIIAYVKARFGASADAERWEQIYQDEKVRLGSHKEYRT